MPRFTYQDYRKKMSIIADLRYASAVLQWDQETYLPAKGAARRGQQVATLAEAAHERFTAPETGELLQALANAGGLTASEQRNVALSLEDFEKLKKIPASYVHQLASTTQQAFHHWVEARKNNDFRLFAGSLQQLVELKKQETDYLGYTAHPYDALLNDHDKGSTVTQLDQLFGNLKTPLKELLDRIQKKPVPDNSLLRNKFPHEQQWQFGMKILERLGYDFEAGRQDIAAHPFTINFCAGDVRITTRIDENDFTNMTWSTIHEAGHALYEQGLPDDEYGLPLGEAASFSIHESQSRLWENHVGRSQAFFRFIGPMLKEYFPDAFRELDSENLYRAVNTVSPSLIRTEADELTYHFHVMIRYELEKALFSNTLKPGDIPAAWNELYRNYLGITVPDNSNGCLQDVHWSHGSFGYFPTYSLGSFYAAQFFHTASKTISGLNEQIGNGNFAPLLNWLREQVHAHGRRWTSEELCLKISGEPLNTRYFMDYLLDKYGKIYQL